MQTKRRSGLAEFDDRALEWLCAGIMVAWGLTLAVDDDALTRLPLGLLDHRGTSAPLWAAIFCGSGLARLAALYINGRWPRTPVIRTIGASLGFVAWSQLTWLFARGVSASSTLSTTGIGVYAMLALAELYSIYRAAHDVRYDHV